MKEINEIELDTVVVVGGEYSVVRQCVHGNNYYAYICQSDAEQMGYDVSDAVAVSDGDDDMIPCCG